MYYNELSGVFQTARTVCVSGKRNKLYTPLQLKPPISDPEEIGNIIFDFVIFPKTA